MRSRDRKLPPTKLTKGVKVMRTSEAAVCFFLLASAALAQSDRGTITGTIADPAGAVLASAPIEARNVETGAVYQAGTSATGNYNLAQLPTGTYELSVTVTGFKRFVRQNIVLPVAQTLRIDIALEVGVTSDSVTVADAAPLLKTESGELSHNVTTASMNNLPVLGIGSGAGVAGIRNPYAAIQLLPGSDLRPDNSIRINGLPGNSQNLRIDGQDATSGLIRTQSQTQPSVDAIQEVAIQTSNFAAEFGQVGGGFFNVTMKTGTNQFHGSAYEYFVNEALNAGQPFTNNGKGGLLRPRQRRNDYGFTLGGPVFIPKAYNGHDKTFFFFNFEQYRETLIINNIPITVPTAAYRNGNFSQALTGRSLGTDQIGRSILENTVYDPRTDRVVNGFRIRDPFPGNTIPATQIDPVAAKIQALIPQPTTSGLINNFLPTYANPRLTYIPSVKIDHSISAKSKVSGYWSRTYTFSPNANGFPFPISSVPQSTTAHTIRISFDQTLTPTLLLHLGAGLLYNVLNQTVGDYDPVQQLGLKGTNVNLFPSIQGLLGAQGGLSQNLGPGTEARISNTQPTQVASITWVRNNHTYKAGGEGRFEGYPAFNNTYANAWIIFTATESGLPSLNGVSLPGGTVGFPYASFMLGGVDNGFIGVPTKTRIGSHAFSWFVQDTWKVTRKLTLDYGLRWDFESYLQAEHGLMPDFSPSTPNPSVGGRLGAVIFEGYGPGRCNCAIAHNYPLAFGPRVGVAYQITPKTVLRVGGGVSYSKPDDNALLSYSTGNQQIYSAPVYGDPAYNLRDGLPYKIVFPNFDPGQIPAPGTISTPQVTFDRNSGRPPRIIQWSLGLQRELARNLLVEATYVGNRGVWWKTAFMINPNLIDPRALASVGLSLNNPADLQLLSSPLNSAVAAQRGFSNPPYPGFPIGAAVNQALRPFPQFGNMTKVSYAPLGNTWYDAMQAKATNRFSHGLDFGSSFTWSKQLQIGTEEDWSSGGPVLPPTNDILNRNQNKYLSGFDQPFLLVVSGNYTTPGVKWNKALSWVARDWQLGAVLRYGSGLPIMSPIATNGLRELLFRQTGPTSTNGGTFFNRVPGQPLFLQDLNCHCFDPNKTFVLNPAAWTNPAPGQWGTAAGYYTDYRYQRRPFENMSLARLFRIKEKVAVQIRAEFTNIFNRTEMNNPTSVNALATQARNAVGQATAGFGFINNGTTFSAPRQGTLVARFTF
jgi:hypothetical protein